ncbi:hypothetical protein Misp01_44580 [Microtetraspora sp. NBRC 13810]|uniref:pyridoxamine 5'-phosphate oxidase family protein n=1 Tax=Microtetraspora sp. NBRC 13810 TaxID=3030990 RepID=UPI0024A02F43|nr:pyridoxamine 5'-phosphate oxidase family protein [Microtetraspora sp. NBRC 13810]GLW09329.1 hypothetical protein Misp01_44580 [Microtetraspora sp. NBRC 13810]
MSARTPAPGDLGRRIARHRESLGLSREELGELTGMDPGYVEYLELNAASPTMAAMRRLASVFTTSVDDLLGRSVNFPPGRGRAGCRAHLEKLEFDECLRLLTPGGIGRVAFTGCAGMTIMPVNYRLHLGTVLFRTAFGGPLDADLRTGVEGVECMVAFEVDRIDEANREGWHVLVRGPAHHVSQEDELARCTATGLSSWAGGRRDLYIRVRPVTVSGRRIRNS